MNVSSPANRTKQTDNWKGQANPRALEIKNSYKQSRGSFIITTVSILGVELKGTLSNGTSSITLGQSQWPQTLQIPCVAGLLSPESKGV